MQRQLGYSFRSNEFPPLKAFVIFNSLKDKIKVFEQYNKNSQQAAYAELFPCLMKKYPKYLMVTA